MVAYAVRISEASMQAIASEKPDFNLDETREWLDVHESGYFLRDDESALDCQFFEEIVFAEMYLFADRDTNALFRRVVRK